MAKRQVKKGIKSKAKGGQLCARVVGFALDLIAFMLGKKLSFFRFDIPCMNQLVKNSLSCGKARGKCQGGVTYDKGFPK